MRIFLSYRRRDTQHAAGRLADRLNRRFGSDNVFVDVTSPPPGVDYHDYITQAIEQCDVLLAIIGAEWINARTAAGTRRLDEADDLMRLEIAAGLERGIPVVPVLVDDASKPRADQLPPELAALASRQAIRISHASFDVDSDRLIASLTKRRKSRRNVLIAAAIGAITVAATAAVVISPPHAPSATSRTLSPPASSAVKPVSWQNSPTKSPATALPSAASQTRAGSPLPFMTDSRSLQKLKCRGLAC